MSMSLSLVNLGADGWPGAPSPPEGRTSYTSQALSGDGRFLLLSSSAAAIAGTPRDNASSGMWGDPYNSPIYPLEIYLVDTLEGPSRLVTPGNYAVGNARLSTDGGTVLFEASPWPTALDPAANVSGATNTRLFFWHAESGAVQALAIDPALIDGATGATYSGSSADLNHVFMTTIIGNISTLWRYDVTTGATLRILDAPPYPTSSGYTNGGPFTAAESADGRYVVFASSAMFDPRDTNAYSDIFRYDTLTGTLRHVSHTAAGGYAVQGGTYILSNTNVGPTVSADGRYIVYMGGGAGASTPQVWLWDALTDTSTEVSRTPSGNATYGVANAVISADGRFVAYSAQESRAIPGMLLGAWNNFLYDQQTGATTLLDPARYGTSSVLGFSADSKTLIFTTPLPLLPGDTDLTVDLYRLFLHGDTTAPTLAITSSDSDLTRGETATITFAFSELVGGFTLADVALAGGTLSDLWTADSVTWTARFTPTPGWHGTAAFIVLGSAYHDLIGNSGTSAGLNQAVATDVLGATPILFSVTTDTGTAGDFITGDGTLVLHGQAGALRGVQVSLAGGGSLGTTIADMNGQWSLDLTGAPFAPGLYTLHVTADDGAGGSLAAAQDTVLLVTASEVQPHLAPDHGTTRALGGGATLHLGGGSHLVLLDGGNNSLTLGEGQNFVMSGHAGGTTITAGNGGLGLELLGWNNTIATGSGDDQVWAGMGMSLISTGAGNDTVWLGASGASQVDAGAGNDIIYTGGALGDVLRGGAGDDQYVVRSITTQVIENAGEGTDTVWVGVEGFAMPANVEVARLIEAVRNFTGGAGNETIVANQSPGAGAVLDGGAGDDMLYGSAGADVLTGGAGNDVLFSYGGADRYVFGAGWGQDTIWGWEAGQKLDVSGLGLGFADVVQVAGDAMVRVLLGANGFDIHGATAVTVGDFIF